ncbi:MAG: AI-2E family transporter [Reichenbachiella sp.]
MINKTLLSILAITAVFIFGAWVFYDVFVYLVIALVLATILRPMNNFISRTYIFRIKVPRILAILLSFSVVVGVITAFMLLFIPLIIDQMDVLSKINIESVYSNLSKPIVALEDFLIRNGIVNPDRHDLSETIKTSLFEFVKDINIRSVFNDVLKLTGGFMISLLAVSFITFFLLFENGIVSRLLIAMIPNQYFELFISAIYKIENLLSNYLIGLFLQMISIFAIAGIGLSILGVKYALTIALFAAIANLIPYLGPSLGTIFGIIIGISSSNHFAFDEFTLFLIIKISAVFAIVQVADNVFLQPVIFSKSIKAHPLEIFVVIFAAATIAGIPGMIAAVPAYTILRVSIMEIRDGFKSYKVFQISK